MHKENNKFFIDCSKCGQEFECGKNAFCTAKNPNKINICPECRAKYHQGTGERKLIKLACEECNKEFYINSGPAMRRYEKYGLHLCKSCSRKGQRNTFFNHHFTSEQLKKISDNKIYYYNNSENGLQHKHEQSLRYIGENNPMYKPDKKDPYQMISSIRNAAIKRDNHTCQKCNKTLEKKEINVHHKNGANKFTEQRLDVDNLVTLCRDCHILFHRIYGYGDNTELQFNEFLQLGSETIESILNNRSNSPKSK